MEALRPCRGGLVAAVAVLIATLVPTAAVATSFSPTQHQSCGWRPISPRWKAPGNRAVTCHLGAATSRLSQARANALLPEIGRLYVSSQYGPRAGLAVAVPDHCVIHVGRFADCEIEFTRPSEVYPPCGQLFEMVLGDRHGAVIDSRGMSNEITVLPELPGLCHDPGTVAAMLP